MGGHRKSQNQLGKMYRELRQKCARVAEGKYGMYLALPWCHVLTRLTE